MKQIKILFKMNGLWMMGLAISALIFGLVLLVWSADRKLQRSLILLVCQGF